MKFYRAEVTFTVDFLTADDKANALLHDIVEDMHTFRHPHALNMDVRSIKNPRLHLHPAAPKNKEEADALIETLGAELSGEFGGHNNNRRCRRRRRRGGPHSIGVYEPES